MKLISSWMANTKVSILVGMQAGKNWSIHSWLFPPQPPRPHHPWFPGVKKSPRQKAEVLWGCDLVWSQTQVKQLLTWRIWKKKTALHQERMSRTPNCFPYVWMYVWKILMIFFAVSCCQNFASGTMMIYKVSLLWLQTKMTNFRPRT